MSTGSTGIIIIVDDLLANFQLSAPFGDRLHCRYAVAVHVCQLAMNSDEGKIWFVNTKKKTPCELQRTKFQTAFLLAHQLIP